MHKYRVPCAETGRDAYRDTCTHIHTHMQSYTPTCRRGKHTYIQRYIQGYIHTYIQSDTHTGSQADRETYLQAVRLTDTYRDTGSQTDRQADIQAY